MIAADLACDRDGAGPGLPVVLLHAGIADRRMWQPQWAGLTARHEVIRFDLRGFGDSSTRPDGPLDHVGDVTGALDALGIQRCHLVGASFGAGVAVEVALSRPAAAASLLLSAPGGSLMPTRTPDLRAFFEAERAALAAEDLAAAIEANLVAWVDGTGRDGPVDPAVRAAVATMQRRAFEVTAGWDDVVEAELDPPALTRLAELTVPTTVVVGGLDLQAIRLAADAVMAGIRGAHRVDWPDVAHLPSMERPADFLALIEQQAAG